jgi:hypothetical protein
VNEIYYEDKPVATTTPTNTTTQPAEGTATTTPTTETKTEPEKVKKERRTNCIIKLVHCTYGINPNVLTQMIQRETTQENEDKTLKYVKDKRNELETFMYTTKENLTSSLQGFFEEKDAENLIQIFNKTEDWMYNNIEETYVKEKIEEWYNIVTVPGNKIYRRKTPWENLDKALKDAKSSLDTNIKKFELNSTWLFKNEQDELQKAVQLFNDSYNTLLPVCIKSPKFVDPPIDYVSIERQIKDFEDKIRKIFSDADKRVKEDEKKIAEEKKKLEDAAKAAQTAQTTEGTSNNTTTDQTNIGEEKMQLD